MTFWQSDLAADPGIIKSAAVDLGDGRGGAWVEPDPVVGLARWQRLVHRFQGGNKDWNVRPYGFMPDEARPRLDGVERPVVERRLDPSIVKSRYNPRGLPVARHRYCRFAIKGEREMLWRWPSYWLTPEQFAQGAVGSKLHTNKLVFLTGGQSPDQVAMTWQFVHEKLDVLFYRNASGTSSWAPTVTGLLKPDEWLVVEFLISDQEDGYANEDTLRPGRKTPTGSPRHVVMWAAPWGEPPQLVGWTNNDGRYGPGMIPSRANDDHCPIFKWQDANIDDHSQFGMWVLGHEQGGMTPGTRQFDAVRFSGAVARRAGTIEGGATSSRYYRKDLNGHFNPGRLDNWGRGHTLGFTRGALTDPAYIPRHKMTGQPIITAELATHQQAEIESTEYLGRGATPPNGLAAEVHRITLAEPLPLAPQPGDCIAVNLRFGRHEGRERDLKGYPEARMAYAAVEFDIDPIPFPGGYTLPDL